MGWLFLSIDSHGIYIYADDTVRQRLVFSTVYNIVRL